MLSVLASWSVVSSFSPIASGIRRSGFVKPVEFVGLALVAFEGWSPLVTCRDE